MRSVQTANVHCPPPHTKKVLNSNEKKRIYTVLAQHYPQTELHTDWRVHSLFIRHEMKLLKAPCCYLCRTHHAGLASHVNPLREIVSTTNAVKKIHLYRLTKYTIINDTKMQKKAHCLLTPTKVSQFGLQLVSQEQIGHTSLSIVIWLL